ncbi:MBL fold metallo-hydrolase [Bordetella sp. 02P26C-1]|uniref:MBL fold metallo-hydrolase n=1 Tax=Bordetella sp. 02P26C-1 TaxID=2683195 RepID=UPI001352F9E5|nr:MBL fold metallo-hydrolase [Bordetella sp. 02P26C-1]MVW78482.1 MBL fold metallo-hydrolase [Bordetella sp. 02P26C-1]
MRLQIGDVAIDRIEESLGLGFQPHELFPAYEPRMLEPVQDWIAPGFYDPTVCRFRTSIHSWLVRTPKHLILVDTCVGNHKRRPHVPRFDMRDTPWLSRLADLGVGVEDIDYVMCTHLHCDHVGWNTRLVDGRWVPTFPNARYLFGRAEFNRWDARRADYQHRPINDNVFEDSILPVVESGQMVLVEDGFDIDGVLIVEPGPGHTHGHICIRLASQGHSGYFTGDIFHHPLQIRYPELYTGFDDVPELGIQTRRRLLSACADDHALLLPAHFAEPHACHIHRRSDGDYEPDFASVQAFINGNRLPAGHEAGETV